jgi:hypothetical protein
MGAIAKLSRRKDSSLRRRNYLRCPYAKIENVIENLMEEMRKQGARRGPALAGLLLCALFMPALADDGPPPAIKLAVFDFELEDSSAGASALGESPGDIAAMQKISDRARELLAQSGRYSLVDTGQANAEPVRQHSLHTCDCAARIALGLGADQALLGLISRSDKTSYTVKIQVTDARTGQLLSQQSATFAGSDDGWGSGVSTLLRQQQAPAGPTPP